MGVHIEAVTKAKVFFVVMFLEGVPRRPADYIDYIIVLSPPHQYRHIGAKLRHGVEDKRAPFLVRKLNVNGYVTNPKVSAAISRYSQSRGL